MKTNLDHILIFKTNIAGISTNSDLYGTLENHDQITHWNIDTEDSDRVLRIVSKTLSATEIICLINKHGFECGELD